MSTSGSRFGPMLVTAALIGFALAPLLPLPAHGCSCAPPSDIVEWVDQSEAAFVGTLIDKQDAGDGEFGRESIYVFAVEEWVKGDLGEVVEVRSASNGAACGFEFWDPEMRTGAVIYEEGGALHGGLCSQVDPDALLATAPDPGTVSGSPDPTVPPLLAPDLGGETPSAGDPTPIRWIAGLVVVGFVGLLAWLGMRRPGSTRSE